LDRRLLLPAVLVGYIHGIVVVLLAGQLEKLLGLSIDASDLVPQLVEVVRELDQTSLATLAVGAIAIVALVFLRRFVPAVPAPLVVVIGAMAASGIIGLADYAVATVGDIPAGLPTFVLPSALDLAHDFAIRTAHDAVLGWVPRLGRYADASTHPSAQLTPGVAVYRLDDRIFFANASYVRARVLEAINGATTGTRWLVFDAEGVATIDSTGAEMLEQLIDQLATMDIAVVVARAKGPLLEALETAGLTGRIGAAHLYPTVEAAVAACAGRTEPT
jgi:MFS superfamily sulfate permease-like transporter